MIKSDPGFGTPIGRPERLKRFKRILNIGIFTLAGLVADLWVSLNGSIPLPLGMLASTAFLASCLLNTYLATTRHERKTVFEELDNQDRRERNVPVLGQWTSGNDVIISNLVCQTFALKKRLIQSARKSIEISFNFAGGEAFRETLSLIEQQLKDRPDLKVHLLMSKDLLETKDYSMLKTLKNGFGQRFNYIVTKRFYSLVPYPHTEENHVKLMIVDGKYFTTGGSGIHDKFVRESLPEDAKPKEQTFFSWMIADSFRDTDVIGRGNMAHLMREQFFRLYYIWEYRMTKGLSRFRHFPTDGSETFCEAVDSSEKLICNTTMKYLVSGPEHRLGNPITSEFIKRVMRAKRKVKIANLIFNPPRKLAKALAEKLRGGLKIVGLFNGGCSWPFLSNAIHTWTSRCNYHLLSLVYEYKKPNQLYHKKVALFDDIYAKIGSDNKAKKSAYSDYENALFFEDPRVCEAIKEGLNEDMNNSNLLGGQDIQEIRQSFWHKLKGRIMIPFANLMG